MFSTVKSFIRFYYQTSGQNSSCDFGLDFKNSAKEILNGRLKILRILCKILKILLSQTRIRLVS